MKAKLPLILIILIILVLLTTMFLLWKKQPPVQELHLKQLTFTALPGWEKSNPMTSFQAFQKSCKAFLKQKPEKNVGSKYISLKAKDWYPICQAAQNVDVSSDKSVKMFFEQWFTPVAFYEDKPVDGLFTGYYMPMLKGSLTKTKEYNTPIYGLPRNLITVNLGLFFPELKHHRKIIGRLKGNQLIPYYTSKQITDGAIDNHAPVLAWINNRIDRQFLEIEGSGGIELTDGKTLFLGYAGENGRPYTSIARVLIDKGVMTKDTASMQRIRKYFKTHPQQVDSVLNQNQSFVFFHALPREEALGSQGVALTPGYSLAVDLQWVPMGVPVWLNTNRPDKEKKTVTFQRLMIAQDTGGAIRGPVRGDIYWGAGKEAIYIAGHMKNKGYYWLLLPKLILPQLQDKMI
ncbi:murein transglycosylase A [Legionella oakridgensis]|uniref:Membrane-bound lytic murein transglycosylase A n=2 Tax=Legionella oakridgensis TaxID=29423 RepID=W0BEP5_9GAMM|nr:murein transglycosylase A [Legionella oakridgensis]AHE67171.1 membrane-bound lytic murein transglycosylase [Legionella oakridgensis ATCC 33761 = DSM 21215]ETO93140.1 membrane-bound lytic murein transglycosylase [Legionella oakridgensis RV-2-2007]KTD38024.1 Membrane-bound lytic murein transglycosylase [Legionella oakridgensis]STY20254.1 Membrane-bound lytic murein transglycosylase [Legionella longbeachae]